MSSPTDTVTVAPAVPADTSAAALPSAVLPRKALLQALNALAKTAARKGLPILGTVRITLAEGKAELVCTNLDCAHFRELFASVRSPGGGCIPLEPLRDFVKKGAGAEVSMEFNAEGTAASLSCENESAGLEAFPLSHFPETPKTPVAPGELIPAEDLAEAIAVVESSASRKPDRYCLQSVLLDLNHGHAIATDGRRITFASYRAPGAPIAFADRTDAGKQLVIVANLAAQVRQFCKLAPREKVLVTHNDKGVSFAVAGSHLLVQRMQSNYPNYRQVVPRDRKGMFAPVAMAPLLAAIKQVELAVGGFALADRPSVRLIRKAGLLTVDGTGKDGATGAQWVCPMAGPTVYVGVNPKFLLPLAAWPAEAVELSVIDEASPLVFRAPGRLAVIMPIRLN